MAKKNNTNTEENINIKRILTLDEYVSFITEVYEAVIDENTSDYIPEIYDMFLRIMTIKYYSDFVLPEDNDDKYAILYNSRLYDDIVKEINSDQYNAALNAIENKINYSKDKIINSVSKKIENIINGVEEILVKFVDYFGSNDISEILSVIGLDNVKEFDDEEQ